jgi:hypothetical protein
MSGVDGLLGGAACAATDKSGMVIMARSRGIDIFVIRVVLLVAAMATHLLSQSTFFAVYMR